MPGPRSLAELLIVCIAVCVALTVVAADGQVRADDAPVQYGRDILPILSNACFKCHGPDSETREANLRLDTRDGATKDRGGYFAVAPGKVDQSDLILRILSEDPDERMPPADAVVQLKAGEIEMLRQWIAQGAKYEVHWAFQRPVRPTFPAVEASDWVRNPIDALVLARLQRERLRPAAPAERTTLIRRLALDLTGLPPTPEQVEAFLKDQEPLAYERLVDRLLSSPHYGERMAWNWLDAARYADSNGYQGDRERTMWPWRDWVVQALNDNMPYDQFTIWQLAGDLLPDATDEQRLATGFCRNHAINGEGGRIAEENRVDYVMDMAETTATIWMGLTLNCCRCHDHKFDPLLQRDYYSFTAFFNQTPVNGGGGDPQTPPVLAVPDAEDAHQLAELQAALDAVQQKLQSREKQLADVQTAWEREQLAQLGEPIWKLLAPQSVSAEHQTLSVLEDGSILAGGANPENDTYTVAAPVALEQIAAIRLEALRHESMTENGLARSNSGNFVLTEIEAKLELSGAAESKPLAFVSAEATFEQGGFPAVKAFDGNSDTGWAVHEGRFVDREHRAIFHLAAPADIPESTVVQVTLRHDSRHASHNLGRFRLWATSVVNPKLAGQVDELGEILNTPAASRTPKQRATLAAAHQQADSSYRALQQEQEQAKKSLDDLRKSFVKVMVMADLPQPRKTFLLDRGLYNKPGAEVPSATPERLPPLSASDPANRLALARWLMSADHPLTARVTVNRFWQQFFGIGLVKTTEDFGVQGERPVHPELLDWLAVEFRESGWDVKGLLRTIVTSNTYRQSSRCDADLHERDPANRLLARGPRFRMPSWMLRDQALAVSGLLEPKLGGRPVNPYQPAGVWEEASFGNKKYNQDHGEALYRRSLYTFWRRIAAPTMFFDNAARQVCAVNAMRTNTPLHSLLTLNDTTFVEAARVLAQATLQQSESTDAQRIDFVFRRIVARPASEAERHVLLAGLARSQSEYSNAAEEAKRLLAVGESAGDDSLDPTVHAAWTSLVLAVLNLDETLTKE